MAEEKHCAVAVIYRDLVGPSRYELLLQDVISTHDGKQGKRQAKFVGGMRRLPEDSLAVTLTREIVEETYLRYSGELRQICTIPVYDRNDPTKINHMKYGFLVPFSECTGELRTEPLPDDNDLMYPPEWVPADEVGRRLYHTHQPILLAALRELGLL